MYMCTCVHVYMCTCVHVRRRPHGRPHGAYMCTCNMYAWFLWGAQDFWPRASFGILGYDMSRSQSIMRVATTASPVAGMEVRRLAACVPSLLLPSF